jgi:hypothetical protein
MVANAAPMQRRGLDLPECHVDDGAGALDLEDGRVQKLLGSVVEVGGETVKQLGVSLQPLNRPGEGGGGRLVAGRQHGDQLVGDLGACHR